MGVGPLLSTYLTVPPQLDPTYLYSLHNSTNFPRSATFFVVFERFFRAAECCPYAIRDVLKIICQR